MTLMDAFLLGMLAGGNGNGSGGGDNSFVVKITESGGVFSADKTYAEISAAFSSGKTIVADIGVGVLPMVSTGSSFYAYYEATDASSVSIITISSGDSVDCAAFGMEFSPVVVTDLESTTITIDLAADNTVYEFGTLDALTITAIPANGWFEVHFTSGAIATNAQITGATFPKNQTPFTPEINTYYEISVRNGKAAFLDYGVSV